MTSQSGSLRELIDRLPAAHSWAPGSRADRYALVSARVDPRDAGAYRDATRAVSGRDFADDVTADLLCTDLVLLALSWPDLSVLAGIGWALVARSDPSTATWPPVHDVMDLVTRWAQDGLVEDGWLFAAAGLSPAEAQAQIAAGTVDTDGLTALAALRGVPVPVSG